MNKVLIVYHSQGGNTREAAEAVADGVREAGAAFVLKEGLKAEAKDLFDCAAAAFGTPDYFSYMAGGLKDFFDRAFYPSEGKVANKPVGIFVTHGGGGKAGESVKQICRSFKFKLIADPILIVNKPDAKARAALKELGAKLAAAK